MGDITWGRLLLGLAMSVGWWGVFRTLSLGARMTRTLDSRLAAGMWVSLPFVTSLLLCVEDTVKAGKGHRMIGQ